LDCIDLLGRGKIDHHPLRMRGIRLAGKLAGQVWVALPICIRVPIGHARILILAGIAARRSPVGQPVSVGLAQKVFGVRAWFRAAQKISALVLGVAPSAVGIPVPSVIGELGILPVRDRSPARREAGLDYRLRVHRVEVLRGENVHGGAHGLVRIEGDCLSGADVHVYGLACYSVGGGCDGEAEKEFGKDNRPQSEMAHAGYLGSNDCND
jgi:hypothetical protein